MTEMDYRNVARFSAQKLKIINKSAKRYIAVCDQCLVTSFDLPPAAREIIAKLSLSLIGRFGFALLNYPSPGKVKKMSDLALQDIGYFDPLPPYEQAFITTPYAPCLFATTSDRRKERRQWQQVMLATFEPGLFIGLTTVQEKTVREVLKDVSNNSLFTVRI
jgi:hypothetical protein